MTQIEFIDFFQIFGFIREICVHPRLNKKSPSLSTRAFFFNTAYSWFRKGWF